MDREAAQGLEGMDARRSFHLPDFVRDICESFMSKPWAQAMAIASIIVIFWPSILDALARRVRPEDQALMDGGFGEQFLVEMTIVVGDKRLGTDRGVVWFAEGLMGFSGRATAFVLAPRDLRPNLVSKKREGKDPLPAGSIVLRGAPREAYIVVTPLGRQRRAYVAGLKRFMWSKKPSQSERCWPPLTRYRETKVDQQAIERTEDVAGLTGLLPKAAFDDVNRLSAG